MASTAASSPVFSVYAIDFDPAFSEKDLKSYFNRGIGFRMLGIDQNSERSALISFDSAADAQEAVMEMNFQRLPSGHIVRVSKFDRSTKQVKRDADVCIGGVDSPQVEKEVKDILRTEFRVVDLRRAKKNPCLYVQLKNNAEAQKAISRFNGLKLASGNALKANKYLSKTEFEKQNLRIENLQPGFSPAALTREFSKFGKIVSCGHKRGSPVGFVCFENLADTQKAMEAMNGSCIFGGKTLKVSLASNYASNAEGKNIRITNLPPMISEASLRAEFEPLGTVTRISFWKHTGYVNFETAEVASNVVKRMNGQEIFGRKVEVTVAHPNVKRELRRI
ncbi:hypothetical protein L596_024653 [Steinernema carpocapsae]|uniref:RRM domain-containing protein n=1 Tax=Steinernema carpocapsae TaxID=34508 RepID=A0A4U5M5D0_STECR|nr:hypothetical protein L596_024653 [Steinernema carpocapsae]